MQSEIDGAKILSSILANDQAFPDITAEINTLARSIVIKALKFRSMTLDSARSIRSAIGGEDFELIVEGMKPAEIKTLLGKVDKHSDLKTADVSSQRAHIVSLLKGSIAPAEKAPSKRPAAKRKAKPPVEETPWLQSATMTALKKGSGEKTATTAGKKKKAKKNE